MAIGKSSAQLKNFLPGKLHMAVSQAPLTPKNTVPSPTPSISNAEFVM
jgi:hypothetical protein